MSWESPDESLWRLELQTKSSRYLDSRERLVVDKTLEGCELTEIAKALEATGHRRVSANRIRQLQVRARRKLQRATDETLLATLPSAVDQVPPPAKTPSPVVDIIQEPLRVIAGLNEKASTMGSPLPDSEDEDPSEDEAGEVLFKRTAATLPLPDVSRMELADRQVAWALAAKSGNSQAAGLLLQSIDRYIYQLAGRVARRYMGDYSTADLEDMAAEARVRLLKKIFEFDPAKAGWVTYSGWWIRYAATRWIHNHARAVRVPVHIYEARTEVLKLERRFKEESGRPPTDEEIMEALHLAPDSLFAVRALKHKHTHLDAPLNTETSTTVLDLLVSNPSADEAPIDSLAREENSERLRALLPGLRPKERFVIEHRFGIGTDQPLTLEEVGKRMSLTRERVRQIEVKVLAKLRFRVARANITRGG